MNSETFFKQDQMETSDESYLKKFLYKFSIWIKIQTVHQD